MHKGLQQMLSMQHRMPISYLIPRVILSLEIDRHSSTYLTVRPNPVGILRSCLPDQITFKVWQEEEKKVLPPTF